MQDILNYTIITIAIAFIALMAMDFIAGLINLALPHTPTSTPIEEDLGYPEESSKPYVDCPHMPYSEWLEADIEAAAQWDGKPYSEYVGQLLLEEYDRENQQYWAIWHRAFDAVIANLSKNPKIEVTSPDTEVTTQNFPEIGTVNETLTLSDFEGIDYETMLHTNWQTATPLSCDPCNFQFCPLPEPQPALKQTKRAGRPKKEVQTSVKTPVQTVAPKRKRGRPSKVA